MVPSPRCKFEIIKGPKIPELTDAKLNNGLSTFCMFFHKMPLEDRDCKRVRRSCWSFGRIRTCDPFSAGPLGRPGSDLWESSPPTKTAQGKEWHNTKEVGRSEPDNPGDVLQKWAHAPLFTRLFHRPRARAGRVLLAPFRGFPHIAIDE